MAEVDPEDDAIDRYVVRHYRFDPERRERRHVLDAAYDNDREMRRHLERIASELARRRAAGERVDRREHATGSVIRPRDRERAATAHLVRRAMAHGVFPKAVLRERGLPSSMVVFGADANGEAFTFAGVPHTDGAVPSSRPPLAPT
jgi:hypothetical protein